LLIFGIRTWCHEFCVSESWNKTSKSLEPKIIPFLNKKIRRRIKVISSLSTEESTLKIIHLRVAELNKKRSHRILNGYFKCKDEWIEMFSRRYP